MEFEFNFGSQTIAKPEPKDMTLFASVDGVALPLSSDELVFLQADTGMNHIMTLQVLQAMSLTQVFKPIHEHVQHIEQSISELRGQQSAIEKVLGFMQNKGLLKSADDWMSDLKATEALAEPKYAGMVVRTCDRPEHLSRLLESLEQYQKSHDCKHEVLVFDDSTGRKLAQENELLCTQVKLKVTYHGSAWQQQFITMLQKEFPHDATQVSWLLSTQEGFTGGRVWNLALLALAGKKFTFFDDDFLMQPRHTESAQLDKIDLLSRGELGVDFGLNVREIKGQSKVYDEDILAGMIGACGQSFGSWLSGQSDMESSPLYGLRLRDLLKLNQNSKIKTTCNGTWGSPRAESNYWLYQLKGDQREAFWKDRETYLDNIEASHLLHYAPRFQATVLAQFAPSAIDNSEMAPFAMPVNKNEDHFFNAMMNACYPDQVSLHFPMMLGHLQTNKRDRSSFNHIAQRPNFNRFVADYALSIAPRLLSKDPASRLLSVATALDDLSTSDDQMLEMRLREYMSKVRSDLVNNLQQISAEVPDAPIYWQADVRELLQANGQAVRENEVPVLRDWPVGMDMEACLAKARFDLKEIADAMRVWPELWQFCRTQ
ncbi:hypothetical protein [Marinicella rhabdoformis]|uniref:hypothetical protein n=1 Tax=Marinicella rhabdoformis TaxID=2580566 RepID=UPI0012AEB4E6|nr:hypothetical protein [Marinicella rhabdoformis]